MLRAESEGRPQVAGSRIADTFLGFFASLALGSFAFNAPGQSGTDFALSFNGTSDFVTVPNNPVLELTSGTIELWFYPDWVPGSLAYDPVLVGNQQGPALTRYSIQVDRNLTGVTLANGISSSKVAYPFTRGQWYHLALVSSNSTAQVFVNGLPAGNTSNGFGTVIGLSLQLGSDGVGGFFRGQMDEVRIWNTPRGAADLRYNVSRALTGNEPGLIAYWRMDEGVGLTAADATTNGFDGAVNGAAWTNSDVVLVNTSGSFGTALDFSSSRGSYVQVPPAPSLALSNQFTFEAWIKPRTAQCNTILARGDGLNLTNTDFIFQVGNDGTNCGLMKVALMVTGAWTASASTVPLNAWTHVAVTYDGLTNRFFINGLLDGAVAANGNAIYQSGSALFIGRQGVSGNNYFDGTLDEVRVWNTVRSPAQIQTNLSRVLPPNEPGMIGYWRFNEQAGIRAFDSSGLGNHGTESRRPMRVGSFWVPVLTPIGPNPTQQECHIVFADLGASGTGTGIALDTGYSHALLVDPDGTVRGWGAVGANDGQATIPPVATNIVSVGTGFYHSLALKADGTVLGWGYNNDGEVNIPRAATNVIAIGAGAYYNVALKSDGTILAWGRNVSGETNVPPSATNIVAVAAGDEHVVALRADGAVISWGRSNLGQTNVPPGAINAIDVAAGGQFSFAMRNDGTLIGWGANDFGELSAPPAASGSTAISLGDGQVLAVKPGGTALGWGRNDYGQGNIPASRTNVTLIAAGEVHSLAVVSDGAVLAWGYNQYGAANVPAAVNQLSLPVLIRGMVNTNTPGSMSERTLWRMAPAA